MPPNPDMQTVMSQMAQMQSAQASSTSMLASAVGSLQQTIAQMATATQLGVSSALAGGQTALQSLQLGAATAMGDIQSLSGGVGGALQFLSGGAGAPPPVPGVGMAAGGGMSAGGASLGYGASIGALSLAGAVGGFAAWEMTAAGLGAGFRAATGSGAGFMASVGTGARLGSAALGGGLRGAIGGALGGGAVAAGAIAIPLAAALAVEEAASIGIERISNTRDVAAILAQQSGRIIPFDAGAGIPTAGQFRGDATGIVRDLTRRGMGGEAPQFISQAAELGLLTGAGGEAGGIRGRARELADAVKEMTRLLGTSLEEGLTMMAELRQTGFEGMGAPGAVMTSRGRGRLGGFTAGEMHAVGMRGAQEFRGMGISPTFGFNAAQSNLAQISDMINNNLISNDLVATMGGRQRMAQLATQGQAAFLQGAPAQAYLAAGMQPGGIEAVMGRRMDLGQAAMAGLGGGDPQRVLEFLGGRGKMIADLGPAAIQGMRFDIFSQMIEQRGLDLGGLSEDRMMSTLAGFAGLPGVGRAIGISGPEEARLFAQQFVAAPESMRREAQAMRSERQREVLARYNEQNVGWSGFKFRASTFANEVTTTIGEPFVQVYNTLAGAVENIEDRATDAWNEERTEILTKKNVTAISRFEARMAQDPAAYEDSLRTITDPDDVERIKKRIRSVTLSGTMDELHNQLRVGGLVTLGSPEETGESVVGKTIKYAFHTGGAIDEINKARVFTVEAVRGPELDAVNRQANEMFAARITKDGASEEDRKSIGAQIDMMLKEPALLSKGEKIQIGMGRRGFAKYGVGPGDWFQTVKDKDINTKAISYINDSSKPVEERERFARNLALSLAGGDKEQARQFMASDFVPEDVQALASQTIDTESQREGLQSDPEKIARQYKQSAKGLAEDLLGQFSEKDIKIMQANMDTVSLVIDANSSPTVAWKAAQDLAAATRKSGREVQASRIFEGRLRVTEEQAKEARRFAGRAGAGALRRRIEREVGIEVGILEEHIVGLGRGGAPVEEEDAKAISFIRKIGAAGIDDINNIVDSAEEDTRDRARALLRGRGPVMTHLIDTFTDLDFLDEKAIKKSVGLVEGAERIKQAPSEQLKVEAFQSESIKSMRGINATVANNLSISEALMNDALRLGIQVSRN